jgi:hypothetical protein
MSVVIIGGHDRMKCQYKNICKELGYAAKVYTQPIGNLECMIGSPDLIILFTNPVSHRMIAVAKKRAAQCNIAFTQSHSGSGSALKKILIENLKESI